MVIPNESIEFVGFMSHFILHSQKKILLKIKWLVATGDINIERGIFYYLMGDQPLLIYHWLPVQLCMLVSSNKCG